MFVLIAQMCYNPSLLYCQVVLDVEVFVCFCVFICNNTQLCLVLEVMLCGL